MENCGALGASGILTSGIIKAAGKVVATSAKRDCDPPVKNVTFASVASCPSSAVVCHPSPPCHALRSSSGRRPSSSRAGRVQYEQFEKTVYLIRHGSSRHNSRSVDLTSPMSLDASLDSVGR